MEIKSSVLVGGVKMKSSAKIISGEVFVVTSRHFEVIFELKSPYLDLTLHIWT